ncbi:RAMP superfamily CRISPR-associated protein [Desulfonatronovibrio magnus]|uniref:RAMP superfamily CRISPR-associated protein n=1 Tax=Desulfonatronovibrio magnus TaxID=698827 RepID=UPI0005EAE281|nr:RAMP superfamily CRISPR-associated protein [Desulfonatronovibrio magnus]
MSQMVIPYTIILNSSLVLTRPGGDTNSAATLPYISGSSIIGALAANWRKTNNKKGNLSGDSEFNNIFLSSNLRCSHAYPVRIAGNQEVRLLPAPLSLWTAKDQPEKVFDLANTAMAEEKMYEPGLRPWQKAFIQFGGGVHFTYPRQEAYVHHQRDREKGKATTDTSIFSYVSLSAGQKFSGYFFCENDEVADFVNNTVCGSTFFLGRSKAAQYGGNIQFNTMNGILKEDFVEADQKVPIDTKKLTVTLTSEYIGRDTKGQYRADAETWLNDFAQAMEMQRQDFDFHDELNVPAVFSKNTLVGGYIPSWHMPRPVRPALVAGSVLLLNCKSQNLSTARLKDLLWKGIGERLPEGFGRFVINWHGMDDDNSEFDVNPIKSETLNIQSYSGNQAEQLITLSQTRMLKKALFERCQSVAARSAKYSSNICRKSALGRIRQEIRTLPANDAVPDFVIQSSFKDNLKKPFFKQLSLCKVGHESLIVWLEKVYKDFEYIKNELQVDDLCNRLFLSDKEKAKDILDQMVVDYRHYMVDFLMQELSRIKSENEEGGE